MEERIAKFIAAMRAAGVRISVAESQDAWQAITHLGALERALFQTGLRTTLIKDARDFETFDELFPLYFSTSIPPMQNLLEDLSPDEQEMLRQAMQQALEDLARDLERLLNAILNGRMPTEAELDQLAEQAGMSSMTSGFSAYQAERQARRMQRLLGMDQLAELLDHLWELLAELGIDPAALEQLKAQAADNAAALQEQISQHAGMHTLDRLAEHTRREKPVADLMQRPFESLNAQDMDRLRDEIRRLAARLRSQAALRYKRGKKGKIDAKATLRANLRYANVPFEIHLKQRRRKPRLVVILDISTSMRPVAEFFLRLLYALQDQVQKTRSFAFIDHLEDVTDDLTSRSIDQAITTILTKMPPGHYSTDLGHSLRQFEAEYMDALDSRTTFIVLGDARNNYNDPALEVFRKIGSRARKVVWLNPEFPGLWGTGDSDMPHYLPYCDQVFQVQNLDQLTQAIDQMLT